MDSHEENHVEKEKPLLFLHRHPSFPPLFKDSLSKHFWTSSDTTESFLSPYASDIRVLYCGGIPLTANTLRFLPNLEIVVASSVGMDHIDLAECRRRSIITTNAGPAFAEDVADPAVAMMIDVLRKMSASDRYVRQGQWPKEGSYPLGSKVLSPLLVVRIETRISFVR